MCDQRKFLTALAMLLAVVPWTVPAVARTAGIAQSSVCQGISTVRDIRDVSRHIRCEGRLRKLWIVAEIHGTHEVPELLDTLVEQESADHAVVLALEMPTFEQPALDAYLASPDSAADRRQWLDTPFWSRLHDGRSSAALLQTIDHIKAWRHQGRRIDIVAAGEPDYDAMSVDKAGGIIPFKERGMALKIRVALKQDARVIALMGDYHAQYQGVGLLPRPADAGPSVVERLSDESPLLIWVTAARGEAWTCQGDDNCGARNVGDRGTSIAGPQLRRIAQPSAQVGVVELRLPAFTPSGPAAKPEQTM